MSQAVRLSDEDVRLLIGALVTDSLNKGSKEEIYVSAKRIRESNLREKVLFGRAIKQDDKGRILPYDTADILTGLIPYNHLELAEKNHALKRLNEAPSKDDTPVHILLNTIRANYIIQEPRAPRILLQPRPVDHASFASNMAQNENDFAFSMKLQRTAKLFLQSLPELVEKHNKTCKKEQKKSTSSRPEM